MGITLALVVPIVVMAEEDKLESQLASVKAEIVTAQQVNQELKAQLAAKDKEAAALKEKLKNLQDQINALNNKGQHQDTK